jgi:translation initiation factor IF-3
MRNNRSSFNKPGSSFRHNRQIRISPVRLIDQNDEMVGVVPTDQALKMAQDAGLDLVEVAPNVRPPVCKILDYGKWKYQQQKKEDKQRAAQRHSTLKEVKIRTTKIDQHDLMIKVNTAKKFLEAGHKVQFGLQYRGREMAHQELGLEIMDRIKRELFMVSKVEQDFRMMGRRGTMVLAPDRKDPNKVKAPGAGERITVGTKGIRLDQDGPAAPAPAGRAPARPTAARPAAATPATPAVQAEPVNAG